MAYDKIKQNVMAICSGLYLNYTYKVIPLTFALMLSRL